MSQQYGWTCVATNYSYIKSATNCCYILAILIIYEIVIGTVYAFARRTPL